MPTLLSSDSPTSLFMALPDLSEVIQRFPARSKAKLSGQEHPFSAITFRAVELHMFKPVLHLRCLYRVLLQT